MLKACPDVEWKLIFALSRFGGLRCPSEHLALKWGHIDWEHHRITVPSPKTAHHAGGESRLIPLFPELRPHLEAAFNEAEPGSEHVISHHRTGNANLRTQFQRILEKAGIPAWPKLFHNLRATRQTELAADFPLHVVCRSIGNSTEIVNKHYLSVTENDYLRGAGLGDDQSKGSEAAQNAAQQAHASSRTESQAKSPPP
ncbi:Phage integrase family protein [Posidoniimonas corsicana]|uniref:Phage integrase family protein n=1 Tax=Posidoniimonas corsicana TaxID=1938618 RepID=A0A5C5VD59_9BACT|nr:Phage integrase family protein [Posidoniimonas corsicana]